MAESVIDAVFAGRIPDLSDAVSRIAHAAAIEILETGTLSDASYEAALAGLGEQGLVDLVGLVGYYCLVSATLNVFDVPRPDGQRLFKLSQAD